MHWEHKRIQFFQLGSHSIVFLSHDTCSITTYTSNSENISLFFPQILNNNFSQSSSITFFHFSNFIKLATDITGSSHDIDIKKEILSNTEISRFINHEAYIRTVTYQFNYLWFYAISYDSNKLMAAITIVIQLSWQVWTLAPLQQIYELLKL